MKGIGFCTVLALAATGWVGSAHAQNWTENKLLGNTVSLSVDSDDNGTLPIHRRGKQYYVAGGHQERYSLRLHNETGQRVLAVVSVDGVNVVSGETASVGQTGYVLSPWGTTTIKGWRKSTQDVARFYFTARNNSYANQTGRGGNEGIIGVAVFREKYVERHGSIAQSRSVSEDAAAAPAARGMSEKSTPRLGTGHGERETSYAELTGFDRASRYPSEVLRLEYDTRQNLIRRGVIGSTRGRDGRDAFPNDQRFVPDPPRW